MTLEFEAGMEVIASAMKAGQEEKLYLRWVCGYQFSMTYDDFLRQVGYQPFLNSSGFESGETAGVILKKVRKILDGDF